MDPKVPQGVAFDSREEVEATRDNDQVGIGGRNGSDRESDRHIVSCESKTRSAELKAATARTKSENPD